MVRKLRKLCYKPHLFLRDYLNKKYPVRNTEQSFTEPEEVIVSKVIGQVDHLVEKNSFQSFPIDVVFTWVDHSDDKWNSEFRKYSNELNKDNNTLYSSDLARFENHNELYYSIYSVLKFMPWVRKIFIVTANQIPSWFNQYDYPKVEIVYHEEIIEQSYLPTFNSHVIEASLYRIPDLSEHFIYFNDDVFVAKPLSRTHFFQPNGLASVFFADKSIRRLLSNNSEYTSTLWATINSINLIQRNYAVEIDTTLVHTYSPLRKSIYKKLWEQHENEILSFLSNRFRSKNDLNFTNFLVPWIMYLDGLSYARQELCYYFNIRSPDATVKYQKLLINKEQGLGIHSFCANDVHHISNQDNLNSLELFLRAFYEK